MMNVKSYFKLVSFVLPLAFLLTFTGCSKKTNNPFSDRDAEVKDNIEKLMGLSVGMTKQQVFSLSGVSNYVEGYDWGSVWFYKIRKGGSKEGQLANQDIETL